MAAICLAILGLESWREWTAYEAALQRAISSNLNLSRSLTKHADDTFELAEEIVGSIAYEARQNGEAGLKSIEQRLRGSTGDNSRFLRVDVFGPEGEWRASTAGEQPPIPQQTSFSYFQSHQNSPSEKPLIGKPLQAPDGNWILTVSQRLNQPDGSFGGVVVAMIDSQYFTSIYSSFDVGDKGMISLSAPGGTLLARYPYDRLQIGRDFGDNPVFAQLVSTRQSGDFEMDSSVDGVRRIGAFDVSQKYPLVAVVAVSRDEALSEWLVGAIQRLTIAAILTAGVAILGMRLAEQIARRQESEKILAAKEAEFRLLAESASDLVERFTGDGIRLYISPAMERLLGHKPHELLGTNAFETIIEEDRPTVYAAAERLRRAETTEETVVFRARHLDGREIWLETALRKAVSANPGEQGSVVGVTRDVTERKQLEMKLASLATIDGLTGLANRRAFDIALEREVGRCQRSRTPLSLLMLDCDRFKRFNDDYGHLAGDGCLKAIAAVIMDRARRPLDIAARYGGEEMALLLPDTDIESARALGNEICRKVQGLGIPHDRNLPWKVATVSIGIATLDPVDAELRDGNWLIAAADLSLYDAKAQGRNKCVAVAPADPTRLVG